MKPVFKCRRKLHTLLKTHLIHFSSPWFIYKLLPLGLEKENEDGLSSQATLVPSVFKSCETLVCVPERAGGSRHLFPQ